MNNFVTDSYKMTSWNQRYVEEMSANNDWKLEFFLWKIWEILKWKENNEPLDILDVWACNWDLLIHIDNEFWQQVNTLGVDISNELVNLAPVWKVLQWDGYYLNRFQNESFDVLTYSSFLHELGSYHVDKKIPMYTRDGYYEWIKLWLSSAERVLKKWWYLLIKDPVRPINDKEIIKLYVKNKTDLILTESYLSDIWLSWIWDINLNYITKNEIEKILTVNEIKNIPYVARLILFLYVFKWTSSEIWRNLVTYDNWSLSLTRWIIAEISRHMPWVENNKKFFDEANEWYWSLNYEEWGFILDWTSFELVEHNISTKESDHAKLLWDNFLLLDSKWNELKPHKVSPTHHYTILKKV